MTARLWCFGESGNAYKAALTLQMAGHDWEPVYVDFFNGEARGPEFRALNPMGEVPVFREGDLTLTQSAVIQMHVADLHGKFWGTDRNETLRWLMFDNHKVSASGGPARFQLNFIPQNKRPVGAAEFLQGRLLAALKVLDAHLADRDWVAPGRPDHRRFRAVRLPLLSRALRLRSRRMEEYRPLAGRHRRPARLETPL